MHINNKIKNNRIKSKHKINSNIKLKKKNHAK